MLTARPDRPTVRDPRGTATARLAFVDALRGWAILAVMLVHVQLWFPAEGFLVRLLYEGRQGVQLFYVASAFTLFLSLASRPRGEPRLYFFIRRFFRIAPLFYATIVLYVAWFGLGPRWDAPRGLTWWDVGLTALFLHGWHPETINSTVPFCWSIAVEMNFYLLVPLAFAVLRRLRHALLAAGSALAVGAALPYLLAPVLLRHYPPDQAHLVADFLYLWLPNQMVVFCLGFVLYFLLRARLQAPAAPDGTPPPRWAAPLALAGLGLFVLRPWMPQGAWPVPLSSGLAALLLGWGLGLRPLTLLVNPFARYVGKISYSAYLLHAVALRAVHWFWQGWAFQHGGWRLERLGNFALWRYVICLMLVVLVTVALATVSYHLIEAPGQRLGKLLIGRLAQRRQARLPVAAR